MAEPNDHGGTPQPTDRANTIPWPPILYAVTFALAYVLHVEWPLPAVLGPPLAGLIGWPLLGAGLAVAVAGVARFLRLGTAIEPTKPAAVLATDGIYAYTRNPMYVGVVTALLGLALATRWTWLLVLTLILPFLLVRLAISREEAYLSRRFGTAYEHYRAKVRRWL